MVAFDLSNLKSLYTVTETIKRGLRAIVSSRNSSMANSDFYGDANDDDSD